MLEKAKLRNIHHVSICLLYHQLSCYWKPPFLLLPNRERKIENKKLGNKKVFLCFYSVCMFLFVYLCVCLSVISKLLCRDFIHRVYKMFVWFAGDGFR